MALFSILLLGCGEVAQEEVVFEEVNDSKDAFIVVHMEPGGQPDKDDYVIEHWPSLVDLVAEADSHDAHLTLLFNPQWASYIVEDDARLELVRSWEENGHELGLHHHGPHMKNWNGYTNQNVYQNHPDYVGNVLDMMKIVNQLPASGQVMTACIGGGEDEDVDWPKGVKHETNGASLEDLISTPEVVDNDGQFVLKLTHHLFNPSSINGSSFEDLIEATSGMQAEEVMGIVFHANNYTQDADTYDLLFDVLQQEGVDVITVSEILLPQGL